MVSSLTVVNLLKSVSTPYTSSKLLQTTITDRRATMNIHSESEDDGNNGKIELQSQEPANTVKDIAYSSSSSDTESSDSEHLDDSRRRKRPTVQSETPDPAPNNFATNAEGVRRSTRVRRAPNRPLTDHFVQHQGWKNCPLARKP